MTTPTIDRMNPMIIPISDNSGRNRSRSHEPLTCIVGIGNDMPRLVLYAMITLTSDETI